MKVLVIGSGGREHALVWKLAQSPHITRMWCTPGNGGIQGERLTQGSPVECLALGAEDIEALLAFAKEHQPDLTVVGPDNPLAEGIVDRFQAASLRIWGPNQSAARFESSKAFAQEFMERHGIPTARSGVFNHPEDALAFARSLEGRCAIKADGLALGKGVLIADSVPTSEAAIRQIMVDRTFGQAGSRIVIQEFLEGVELSLHALCDGSRYTVFPTSQDHKRALENDEGLNTGGMGVYSPTPFVSEAELQTIKTSILDPWLEGCRKENIDFRGMLYPGLMLTREGPKVLEFNARFGDPETQVYLMRLQSDLFELLWASAEGTLDQPTLSWADQSAVCVVMASGGYPETYRKGLPIQGLDTLASNSHIKVFHAGTRHDDQGQLVTSGGRVLGVTALGPTLKDATQEAYKAVSAVHFEGAHFRRDIAAKALL